MLVGVISDTHGTLPAAVHDAFAGVSMILHAGDVGSQSVIDELETIAPVVAVHGNMDRGDLSWRLPERAVTRIDGLRFLVGHIAEHLTREGVPEGVDVVVTGHTHRASVRYAGGVLRVNPGSAS